MLKLDLYVRFALIAGSLILGIVLSVWQGFWYGFPFFLVAIVLVAGYVLLGTIRSASELLQEQKIDEAEARLALTKFPQYLFPANKAYYYMIHANIALVRKDSKKAENFLREASKYDMPSGNETAVIELQLANIAAQKNNWPEVNQRIQAIRKLKVTEPMIVEQAGMLEKAYRNRGNVQMAQRMGPACKAREASAAGRRCGRGRAACGLMGAGAEGALALRGAGAEGAPRWTTQGELHSCDT